MKNKLLSIIIPAFNEEENIENTAKVVSNIMQEAMIPYEPSPRSWLWQRMTAASVAWNSARILARRPLCSQDSPLPRAAAPW